MSLTSARLFDVLKRRKSNWNVSERLTCAPDLQKTKEPPIARTPAEELFQVLSFRLHTRPANGKPLATSSNDPNDPFEIMVTSLAAKSALIRPQNACSDVVFVDVFETCFSMLQTICQVYRLNQVRAALFLILTLDSTYVQTL